MDLRRIYEEFTEDLRRIYGGFTKDLRRIYDGFTKDLLKNQGRIKVALNTNKVQFKDKCMHLLVSYDTNQFKSYLIKFIIFELAVKKP